jgi:hypothetical protein
MKGETQAIHLSEIMQKQRLYPEYELAFPMIEVKKSSLKRLAEGDLLLLGLEQLEMVLLQEGKVCANAILDETCNSRKIRITSLEEDTVYPPDSKKYKIVKCSLGRLQSRVLEVGHQIGAASLDFHEVVLVTEEKIWAKGSLVNVDDEIAVQIDEVKR